MDEILARVDSGGNTAWYLTDHLGSVRDIVNSSGTVLDHIAYDSYGNILSESNAANGDRFKYAGMQYDSTTGLSYDQARWYDPSTGRFISRDPSGFGGGDDNLYRYVGNGPTDATDRSGLQSGGSGSLTLPEYPFVDDTQAASVSLNMIKKAIEHVGDSVSKQVYKLISETSVIFDDSQLQGGEDGHYDFRWKVIILKSQYKEEHEVQALMIGHELYHRTQYEQFGEHPPTQTEEIEAFDFMTSLYKIIHDQTGYTHPVLDEWVRNRERISQYVRNTMPYVLMEEKRWYDLPDDVFQQDNPQEPNPNVIPPPAPPDQ